MKKSLFYVFSGLIVCLTIWVCLKKQTVQKSQAIESTNEVALSLPPSEIASNRVYAQTDKHITNIIESESPVLINPMTATNIEQWKSFFSGLHRSTGLTQRWVMEQTNRSDGIPAILAGNGQSVLYKVRFIDVEPLSDGTIRKVEMHSPIMNIDETRQLGIQLCNMLGRDPAEFLAWCNNAANHGLDSALFSSGGSQMSNSDNFGGFGILRTYDSDKPWYIDFFITSP
jgi:hypothetical protein